MRASLSDRGVELKERDFFKQRLTEEELRGLIGHRPVAEVFSWRSPTFKKMGLDSDSLSDDDLIRMILNEPRLIRRPIICVDEELIVGNDAAAKKAIERVFG